MVSQCYKLLGHLSPAKKDKENTTPASTRHEMAPEQRWQIIGAHKMGHGYNRISKTFGLKERVGDTVRRYKSTGNPVPPKRKGRPCTLTADQLQLIRSVVLSNNKSPLRIIQFELEAQHHVRLHYQTLLTTIHGLGLRNYVAAFKPLLDERKRAIHFSWAEQHLNWTLSQWESVIFSDESKFTVFSRNKRVRVWREPGEENKYLLHNCVPRVQAGGGSVMIWGCIWKGGVGCVIVMEESVTGAYYQDRLKKYFLPWYRELEGAFNTPFFYQEDGAAAHSHKCRATKQWMEENYVRSFGAWPPSSHDMNIIEVVWDILEKRVRARRPLPGGTNELRISLLEEWWKIEPREIQQLYSQMPRRVRALHDANGWATKY